MHHGQLKITVFLTTALASSAVFAQSYQTQQSEQWPALQHTQQAAPVYQQAAPVYQQVQPVAYTQYDVTNQPVEGNTFENRGFGAPHPSYGAINSQGGGAIPALPLHIMVSPAGVYFVNGGIGDEEIQQLGMVENEFNVQVLLSNPEGAFVSGKTLRIMNESGQELLNVDDAGPYIYSKLPAGNYKLEVYDQKSKVVKHSTLKVREKGVTKEHLFFTEE